MPCHHRRVQSNTSHLRSCHITSCRVPLDEEQRRAVASTCNDRARRSKTFKVRRRLAMETVAEAELTYRQCHPKLSSKIRHSELCRLSVGQSVAKCWAHRSHSIQSRRQSLARRSVMQTYVVYPKTCVWTCVCVVYRRHVCVDMCVDMCVGICVGICVGMYVDVRWSMI